MITLCTCENVVINKVFLFFFKQSGKASVGDVIYKQLCTAEKFYPDQLLDILKISSEHEALELADKVEASLVTWRRKTGGLAHSKSSWDMMKDMGGDAGNDKNHILAARARSLLFCLKQRFPELSQTSLDICKIQYNRVSSPHRTFLHFVLRLILFDYQIFQVGMDVWFSFFWFL